MIYGHYRVNYLSCAYLLIFVKFRTKILPIFMYFPKCPMLDGLVHMAPRKNKNKKKIYEK